MALNLSKLDLDLQIKQRKTVGKLKACEKLGCGQWECPGAFQGLERAAKPDLLAVPSSMAGGALRSSNLHEEPSRRGHNSLLQLPGHGRGQCAEVFPYALLDHNLLGKPAGERDCSDHPPKSRIRGAQDPWLVLFESLFTIFPCASCVSGWILDSLHTVLPRSAQGKRRRMSPIRTTTTMRTRRALVSRMRRGSPGTTNRSCWLTSVTDWRRIYELRTGTCWLGT